MDWMEFIVGLISAVAWPITALIILLLCRTHIASLVPYTKKLKIKDFEVEFKDDIDQLEENARTAFPELRADPKARLISTARHLPNSCILEAWDYLHMEAQALTEKHFPEAAINKDMPLPDSTNPDAPKTGTPYKDMGMFLTDQEVLDQRKSKLFNELRRLRNKVAHAENYEVGGQEATQYIELCFRLVYFFQSIDQTLSESSSKTLTPSV